MTDHFNTDEFQVPTHKDLFDFEDDVSYSSFSGFSATSATNPTSARRTTSDDPIGNGETMDPAVNPKEPIPSSVGHILQHLLESNQMMLKTLAMQKSRTHRVYVDMPDKFTGKVGDYIDSWLEQFETWFRHREMAEGTTVEEEMNVDTAIQNTSGDILLTLSRQQRDYGQWTTWKSFAEYMRTTYGSMDSGYMKWIRLRKMSQQAVESVDVYYARFHKLLSIQKKRMTHLEDNHIYNFMFLNGLRKEITSKILSLPEARLVEDYSLTDVFEFAKRAEQNTRVRDGLASNGDRDTVSRESQAGPIRSKKGRFNKNRSEDLNSRIDNGKPQRLQRSDASLSEKERTFLKKNIERGGGWPIHKETRMKSAWMECARKEGRCTTCAATGHGWRNCKAEEDDAKKKGNGTLNAMTSARDADSKIRDLIDEFTRCKAPTSSEEVSHLCSLQDQRLMTYSCQINGRCGKAITDTGASRNFISRSHAEKSGVKFLGKESAHRVLLPNGQAMNILGYCEFEITMSEWKGRIQATVIDIQADFDVVLGLEWFEKYKPEPDWTTLDWYIRTPKGMVQIAHDTEADAFMHSPRLTTLQEIGGLNYEIISLDEAMKDLRAGRKGIFHFARSEHHQIQIPKGIPRLNSLQDLVDNTDDPEIQNILKEYKDIFREELPKELPPKRKVDHVIDTGNEQPVNKNAHPLSKQQLEEQANQVSALLERGLIRESASAWGAPVLFVAKKTPGEWRMCINYRALNAKTFKNAYPLPRIQECIDKLGKASKLSSIDLTSGYWQVRIAEQDIPKTAFNTRYGKYEFLVMPFGLTNAPATFQTLMNSVLRPYIDKFVLVYLDDILVYSNSDEEHREHLRLVFQALRENGLFARPLKCIFNQPTVEFCGHKVGQGVVRVLESKVDAIRNWPKPRTVHEVRRFYGLVNYYRRFIKHFSLIGAPLSDLFKAADGDTRKNRPVLWNTAHQVAFDRLKQAVTSAPILIQPDENKPYTIETDSSDYGNGMTLMQEGEDGKLNPVAFDGRKLHGAELKYPTHEKELLAIKEALQ